MTARAAAAASATAASLAPRCAGRGTETNAILGWAYIRAAANLGHEPATARIKQRPDPR